MSEHDSHSILHHCNENGLRMGYEWIPMMEIHPIALVYFHKIHEQLRMKRKRTKKKQKNDLKSKIRIENSTVVVVTGHLWLPKMFAITNNKR